MQSLEARVAYLEGLLQQARPDVASDHLVGAGQGRSDLSPEVTFPEFQQASTPRSGEKGLGGTTDTNAVEDRQRDTSTEVEDTADPLSADVALLCLTAAGKEPHYFGPSSAVTFSRVVSAAMNLPNNVRGSRASTTNFDHGGSGWGFARPCLVTFPSGPLGTALSQAYFNNIHPQYPFLHRPTFQFWEEMCFRADDSGDISNAGDIAQFFVWMVCISGFPCNGSGSNSTQVYAIASLTLGPAHYDTAESYYHMALAHQPSVLELDSIESIQSLLCCAVYSVRSPAGVSLWYVETSLLERG